MRLYNVQTLEEAEKKIQENFQNFKTSVISLNQALGRLLSEDIHAAINVPDFRRSTVDGYALCVEDTQGASENMPMLLELIGEAHMGQSNAHILKAGQVMYVPTGGMLPEGANGMVMIEYTEAFTKTSIAVSKQVVFGEHIVKIGDDVKKGDLLLKKGTRLASRHIGVLAAIGQFEISVYDPIKLAIISTGDELIIREQVLEKGQVFDINSHTLKHHAEHFALQVIEAHVLKDDRSLIQETLSKCLEKADIVLISGGSSVGHKDYTADIIETLSGQPLMLHGLAIKPGKPTILGKVNQKMVLGLPGHPVSALIVFDQLMRMYLNQIGDFNPIIVKKKLSRNLHAAAGKTTFVMAKIEGDLVTPILGKSSMITSMSLADGYLKIDADTEGYNEGEILSVYLWE